MVPVSEQQKGMIPNLVGPAGALEAIAKSCVSGEFMKMALSGSSTVELTENTRSFADCAPGEWYYDSVAFVSGRNLFLGIGDSEFGIQEPMTRAMLVTVLHRLEGLPKPDAETAFPDVPADSYYADAAAWAAGQKLAEGDGTGFNPEGYITREALAAIFYRYAAYSGCDTGLKGESSLSGFSDRDEISPWAMDAMTWITEAGILKGSEGKMEPKAYATRAEVAALFMRLTEYLL